MKRELERIEIPNEHDTRARSWAVVSSAFAGREPQPRGRSWKPVVVIAAVLVALAGLLSTPGRAVLDEIREVVGVEKAEPALFSLPAPGGLLVTSDAGAWVVDRDGSKRLLGNYREASWSPFGAFIVAAKRNELAALEPDGDVRWTLARRDVRFPRWGGTRADTRIAYLSGAQLRIVAGDGTGDRRLARRASSVAAAWRPGPAHVLTYARKDGFVRVVDAERGTVLSRSDARDVVEVDWVADRRLLLTPRRASLFDDSGQDVLRADGHFTGGAISPRAQQLALVTVRGWNERRRAGLTNGRGSPALLRPRPVRGAGLVAGPPLGRDRLAGRRPARVHPHRRPGSDPSGLERLPPVPVADVPADRGLVLRGLILAAVLALGATADSERRFENDAYGHSVLVPPGWSARLSESGTTNVLSYRSGRLDRLGSPPRGQVRVVVADYGRGHCTPGTSRESAPTSLGRRVSFEGFPDGYSVGFCLRGHSFQALVPVGRGASAALIEQARQVVASIRLTPRAREVDNAHSVRQLGRSVEGRPIRAWRIGNPKAAQRVLVVGCIHGDECAGLAVTQRLVNLARPIDFDLWIVQLNPDGLARGTRGNAHGVDLNRDFLAATERETRIARKLILRLRPAVTIWFHQPQSVVRAWGPSRATARRYARLAGVPYRPLVWPPGSASRWQNGLGQVSFVVELPPGELPDAVARRHADAVLRLAD